jgi:formate hydrogenlyase transcriptional activator
MTMAEPNRHAIETGAQLVLRVAKAASTHLDLGDVLESLVAGLRPQVRFDAVAVVIVDGDYVRMHSAHIEGMPRNPGESMFSLLSRRALELKLDPPETKRPLSQSHISTMTGSHLPYVCSDTDVQTKFGTEKYRKHGIRSFISLPLLKHGTLLGSVDFMSVEKREFSESEVQLLQEVSEIVSIAVSNALAFEEIKALKEQLQLENHILQDEIVQRSIYEEIVGSSTSLQKVLAAIEKVSATDTTVLITGETGTGKELVAHAIHRLSPRSSRALVKVNCAALPAELIASELFGHEKGSFTGALQQRIGRFEAANGGTIFLDEIGELTSEMQIALLRVLQEKEFERVGGNKTIHTDVRVIAATNRDLEQEVEEGRFRKDLFYRLSVFPVEVPALRDRADDIPVLVDYFIARLANRMGKRILQIDKRTLESMQQYSWPGNIRELQNVIERGVILTDGEVFRLEPGTLRTSTPEKNTPIPGQKKAEIEAILKETRGRISGPDGAAAKIGVAASTLESRIRALKINKHQFRGDR